MTRLVTIEGELLEKIVAYVDREEGRGVAITAEEEAMIRHLIETDDNVRACAAELRTVNARLDAFLDEVSEVSVPEELVTLIQRGTV